MRESAKFHYVPKRIGSDRPKSVCSLQKYFYLSEKIWISGWSVNSAYDKCDEALEIICVILYDIDGLLVL